MTGRPLRFAGSLANPYRPGSWLRPRQRYRVVTAEIVVCSRKAILLSESAKSGGTVAFKGSFGMSRNWTLIKSLVSGFAEIRLTRNISDDNVGVNRISGNPQIQSEVLHGEILVATIPFMGELSKSYRFSARTAPQVTEGFEMVLARMKRSRKFRGKTLTNEGLLGSIVLDYLARTPDEQAEILDRALPGLEKLIDDPRLEISEISNRADVTEGESQDPKKGPLVPGRQLSDSAKPRDKRTG